MAVQNYKIIFTGPVGAGKTTAIQTLSDGPLVSAEAKAQDMTKSRKSTTTVAMDYGVLKLNDQERIHLYGTPGQERFDFMWDILTEGGIGLILMLDNSRQAPLQDLNFFIDAFKDFIANTALVVGITRTDEKRDPYLNTYRTALRTRNLKAPVFHVDARERQDIVMLVQALLYSLDPGLEDEK